MEHLRRALHWFVNGVAMALGVALVVWAINELTGDRVEADFAKPLPNSSIEISDVEPISVLETVAVSAQVKNLNNRNAGVELELSVVEGKKVIYSCSQSAGVNLGPGVRQRVQIECRNLKRLNISARAEYVLSVKSVSKLQ
ncbi:hypothetical protein [Leptothrix ochracea]|uniref:hypothetical protein n=1 Tax=Leptothrix ochracea TaxID=735331 RepID=UPI0034E28B15